jgi:beta-phosphoglucomutase
MIDLANRRQGKTMNQQSFAAIWDVDGTLVDTAEWHFRAWVRMAAELGRPFTRADFAATFGRRNPEIIRGLFGDQFTDQRVLDIGSRKEEYYKKMLENGVDLLPGVSAMLQDLKNAGFQQALGSSAPRGNVDLILRLTRTEGYFDAIIAMEDTQRGKPDPQAFLLAAERLQTQPSRCVVFEDAVAGIEAARAGGMKSVAIRFVGHHPVADLRRAGADRVVQTLEEMDAAAVKALF